MKKNLNKSSCLLLKKSFNSLYFSSSNFPLLIHSLGFKFHCNSKVNRKSNSNSNKEGFLISNSKNKNKENSLNFIIRNSLRNFNSTTAATEATENTNTTTINPTKEEENSNKKTENINSDLLSKYLEEIDFEIFNYLENSNSIYNNLQNESMSLSNLFQI